MQVALAVRPGGLQERRAHALCAHLPKPFEARVVSPRIGQALGSRHPVDVVYVIDANRAGFTTGLAARLGGRPVVFELGDPQADLFRAQGRALPEVAAGAAVDHVVSRFATGITVRGRGLADVLSVRVPWIELPDGVDTTLFQPSDSLQLRASLGIPPEALVVGLVGSINEPRPPKTGYGAEIVDAITTLGDRNVIGLVVGDGSGLETLRRRASASRSAGRIVLTGAVLHADVPRYVNAMDVCVSTQTDDRVGQSRTTAKLPEYLACDRFVLATDVGGAHEVLPEEMRLAYHGGWDPSYPERLAQRIGDLVPLRDELRRGVGTRAIALERYAYPVLGRRLGDFLTELVC